MRLRGLFSIAAFLAVTSISIMAYANSLDEHHIKREQVQFTEIPVTTETQEIIYTAKPEVTELPMESEAEKEYESLIKSYDWSSDDAYLLTKIAMAEAENQDTEGKALVMLVVLNRAWSEEFPDSIEDVIFQPKQFSPVSNGRWERVEPDQDCWKALSMIEKGWDKSKGALYFESESASRWHRDNLSFLFKHGDHMFYKDKEE